MKIYLAIPYTGHEKLSFSLANQAAYTIIKNGHIPFSPISHSHPIVEESKKNHDYEKQLLGTWEVWERIDFSFIDWCDELWLVDFDQDAVDNSGGVQAELKYARSLGKQIRTIKGHKLGGDSWGLEFPKQLNLPGITKHDAVKAWEPVTRQSKRNLAERIVESVNDETNHYDAVESVERILDENV